MRVGLIGKYKLTVDDDLGLIICAVSVYCTIGHGDLSVIESTMISTTYPSIIESNVRPTIQQLKLGRNGFITQDNDLKHSSKFVQHNRLNKNRIKCCNVSQSPDLKLIEML